MFISDLLAPNHIAMTRKDERRPTPKFWWSISPMVPLKYYCLSISQGIITRSGAIILSDVIATLGGGRAERRMIERPRRRIKRHDDNSEYFWLWGWGATIRVRERTLRLGLRKESRDRKTNTNNGLNSTIDDCGASFWRMEIAIVSVFANYQPEEWFEWNIAPLLFLAAKIKS